MPTPSSNEKPEGSLDLFEITHLLKQQDLSLHTYKEFFRAKTLSLGLAVWPAGSKDDQLPHAEDEVYYVIEGRGRVRVADGDQSVQAGSVIYVAANVRHRFHEIDESLVVLVFWAPPHHSRDAS